MLREDIKEIFYITYIIKHSLFTATVFYIKILKKLPISEKSEKLKHPKP